MIFELYLNMNEGYPFICLGDINHEFEGGGDDGQYENVSVQGKEIFFFAEQNSVIRVSLSIDGNYEENFPNLPKYTSVVQTPSRILIIQAGWTIDQDNPIYAKIPCGDEVTLEYFSDHLHSERELFLNVRTNA